MWFLLLGLALLAMKWLEFGPIATWSWILVLSPFALAMAWWAWADSSGYTARKEMELEQARKKARIDKHRENIGTLNSNSRKK
jgi:small Trp-rich protein